MSTRNTENTTSLYWFGPPESKTLRPVVGVDCLRIACGTRVASSTLYWPADEVGSQTPGRLRPGDLNLHYNSCHILSICSGQNPMRSCLVRQVLRSFWIRSCRMDIPGPTTSVGTRTDYSMGPWYYSTRATRCLLAWSARTTEE
jgi:hypothetical protein